MNNTRKTALGGVGFSDILPPMTLRGSVGLTFALHLLLGNVCLLSTAYAAGPIDASGGDFISREVPMSFNVVTCTWVKTEDGWQPTEDSPCASGKCLKQTAPQTPCLFGLAAEVVAASLPISATTSAFTPWTDRLAIVQPSDRPPILVGLDSVILRM